MRFAWLALLFQGMIAFIIQHTTWFAAHTDLVSWTIVLFTSSVLVFAMFRKYKTLDVVTIILVGYFLRLLLLFWDIYFRDVFDLIHSGIDSEMFYRESVRQLHGLFVNRPGTYQSFLYYVFRLFGQQRIIAQYINLLLGFSGILLTLQIFQRFRTNRRAGKIMLAVGMFAPNFMILNVILLREALVACALIVSFYCFVLWFKDNKFGGLVLAVTFTLIAASFHSAAIAPAIGYAICIVFYDRNRGTFRFKATTVFLIVICIAVVYVIDQLFGATVFRRFIGVDSIPALMAAAGRAEQGEAVYSILIFTGNDALDFLVNTPLRMVYFILSPLPWDWRGIIDVLAFAMSSSFYGYVYYLAYKALRNRQSENRQMIILLLLIAIISAFIFGWGVSNAGTAMRHRDKFFLLHLLMFGLCLGQAKSKQASLLSHIRAKARKPHEN